MSFNTDPYARLLALKGEYYDAELSVNRKTLIRNVKRYNGLPTVVSYHVFEGEDTLPGQITLFFQARWPNGHTINLRFLNRVGSSLAFQLPDTFSPKVSEGISYKRIRLDSVETAGTLEIGAKVQAALSEVVFQEGRKDPKITAAIA